MPAPESSDTTPSHAPPTLRSELFGGCAWMVLGLAIVIASLTMDRLEQQHINPYTVPGLLPGLLGIAMVVLGGALAFRSWRHGALREAASPFTQDQRESRRRVAVVLTLCLGYGVVLIGHGLPFWLASTIYVTAAIVVLQRLSRDPLQRQLTLRAVAKALVIGVCASFIVQWVFQDLFLVRLP